MSVYYIVHQMRENICRVAVKINVLISITVKRTRIWHESEMFKSEGLMVRAFSQYDGLFFVNDLYISTKKNFLVAKISCF